MSTNEANVPRGAATSPTDGLKAQIEAQFAAALEQASLELTQTGIGNPANRWEVYGWGPYQNFTNPPYAPGRIVMTGEQAAIGAGVWVNNSMLADLVGFGAQIELHFFTSNTQNMTPALAPYHCCIAPIIGQNFYSCIWTFTPTEAACLYETNICARICNCLNKPVLVPDYAGFVRHVYDFDPENLWPGGPASPTPGWQFDRPIRYMVVDRDQGCRCDDL